MDNPKISIIIPVYSVEPYISDCLQSVMRQNYQGPMECVVVDDCSPDRSIAIAENLIAGYGGPIEFKVLHHDHNRGLSAARNTGMDAARGDFFFFLDSDDWISDDCIEKLSQPLQMAKYDIVVGDYESTGELSGSLELTLPEGPYNEKEIRKTFCNHGVYVMAWNKLYSKEFLNKNRLRFEEGKVHEDEILAFEISCIEKMFYVVKSVTYYYRIRENSIVTNKDMYKKLEEYAGILQSVKEKVKRYEKVQGIYDYYMYWIKSFFGWISAIDMDVDMLAYFQELTKGYLEPIPSVMCIKNKHFRLTYYACKKHQTYLHYQYVTKKCSNMFCGRIMRNALSLLPNR